VVFGRGVADADAEGVEGAVALPPRPVALLVEPAADATCGEGVEVVIDLELDAVLGGERLFEELAIVGRFHTTPIRV
jgi:hypothetical protein